jgi:aspartyl aminopeptidase
MNYDLVDRNRYFQAVQKAEAMAQNHNQKERSEARNWNEKNKGGMFYRRENLKTAEDFIEELLK